jgi:hypothetical protein
MAPHVRCLTATTHERHTTNDRQLVSVHLLLHAPTAAQSGSGRSLRFAASRVSHLSVPVLSSQTRQQDYVEGVLSYSFYVDAIQGSDTANGTDPSHPLQTLHAALAASRPRPYPSHSTIFLRSGRHYLPSTLHLNSNSDHGLLITAFPNDDAVIIGGVPMTVTWTKLPPPTFTPPPFLSPSTAHPPPSTRCGWTGCGGRPLVGQTVTPSPLRWETRGRPGHLISR